MEDFVTIGLTFPVDQKKTEPKKEDEKTEAPKKETKKK